MERGDLLYGTVQKGNSKIDKSENEKTKVGIDEIDTEYVSDEQSLFHIKV